MMKGADKFIAMPANASSAGRWRRIGQNLDDLSERELAERIGLLKAEIERLEGAILSRQATREAAAAAFKG